MNTNTTAPATVTLTHATRGDTLDAALVKLGAAHIIVRIENADVRFTRKTGLRISGAHTRGIGYDDWMIGADALQALTGEAPAASRQLPTTEAPAAEAAPAAAPAVVEAPAAPAKRSHKKKAPAAATLPAESAETPHGVRALGLGYPLASTHAADAATEGRKVTWTEYKAALDNTLPEAPAVVEAPAVEAPAVEAPEVAPFVAPPADVFPAELPEMEEPAPAAAPTVAPVDAPAEVPEAEHRDAIQAPAPAATVIDDPLALADEALALLGAVDPDPMDVLSLIARGLRALALGAAPRTPAKAPRAAARADAPSRAPKAAAGPLELTERQTAVATRVGANTGRKARAAGRTEPFTVEDIRALDNSEFVQVREVLQGLWLEVAAAAATEALNEVAPSAPAKEPKAARAPKAAPAKKERPAKKAKPAPIAVNSRVDIKPAMRPEYADVVGESQMVGLMVLSISGKSARLLTNAKQTLPKVALADLVLAD